MMPGEGGVFGAEALHFPLILVWQRQAEQPPEEQGESHALLSDSTLGTNAFFLGSSGGPPLLTGLPSTQGITPWRSLRRKV